MQITLNALHERMFNKIKILLNLFKDIYYRIHGQAISLLKQIIYVYVNLYFPMYECILSFIYYLKKSEPDSISTSWIIIFENSSIYYVELNF